MDLLTFYHLQNALLNPLVALVCAAKDWKALDWRVGDVSGRRDKGSMVRSLSTRSQVRDLIYDDSAALYCGVEVSRANTRDVRLFNVLES